MACKKWENESLPYCSKEELQHNFDYRIQEESDHGFTNFTIMENKEFKSEEDAIAFCLKEADKFELVAVKFNNEKGFFWAMAGWYSDSHSSEFEYYDDDFQL